MEIRIRVKDKDADGVGAAMVVVRSLLLNGTKGWASTDCGYAVRINYTQYSVFARKTKTGFTIWANPERSLPDAKPNK